MLIYKYRDYKTNFQISDDRVIVELKTSINKDIDELTKDFNPKNKIFKILFWHGKLTIYNLCFLLKEFLEFLNP